MQLLEPELHRNLQIKFSPYLTAADDGITGTKTNDRTEFNRMIADCEAGKIDIILTKSISRFARNTVDLLNAVRHLKELGISVQFEKEHIRPYRPQSGTG